ncbi:SpoIIE family protein phosphatase [Streptomyces durbertensis]|uniref:SpoIIE family protein phosphatase n=1 Tax=Streptomyces durbertensis TaxID=2448886 RepID=A0ABR6EFH8_9ACTN|nr:SpoIIE family protein phosphatase [Streptomyces durbertensis]MBB1244084.1 SpoIIE family protein phosphatase [Streptomyces durbertensis]
MDTQGVVSTTVTAPAGWPASPEDALALNRLGTFDWDLDQALMYMDATALALMDTRPDEYDLRPTSLTGRVPRAEAARLDLVVSQALKGGREGYATRFRVRCRDGRERIVHTQARILRTPQGRPNRIIGILRDVTGDSELPLDRLTLDAEQRESSVVEETTAALAHARSVRDVLDVLESPLGLGKLGAVSIMLGLVEAGHIQLLAEGRTSAYVPELEYTRVDADFPMSEAVRTMKPLFILSRKDFARRYPKLWPYIQPLEASAAAYLPLVAQGKVIGAMGLLYRDKHHFTHQERTLLTAMTSSIAQGLQRAQLFDQGLELAENLQRFMLPHTIPHLQGVRTAVSYRPAREVRDIGGDWYDVIPLPGGRVACVIGDVQGHDTHAAAVMGQLRIVLRAYATEGHTASTVMARASTFLADLDTDRFATCLYAEMDPSTGWLRMVRAGHLDPLLIRADGSCRVLPVMGSLPLGLLHLGPLDYRETALELEIGETLLMFTDGLVERPGSDLEESVEKLAQAVPQGPLHDLDRLADWLTEAPSEVSGADDVALLLVRRDQTAAPQLGRRLHQYIAPGDLQALGGVRQMVRAATRAWRADRHIDDIALAAHELAANALVHTDGGVTVTVRLLGGPERRLRIEVTDRSTDHPEMRDADDWHRTGRGLMLVDRLADLWGVESRGAGKCVWCEFLSPGAHAS